VLSACREARKKLERKKRERRNDTIVETRRGPRPVGTGGFFVGDVRGLAVRRRDPQTLRRRKVVEQFPRQVTVTVLVLRVAAGLDLDLGPGR